MQVYSFVKSWYLIYLRRFMGCHPPQCVVIYIHTHTSYSWLCTVAKKACLVKTTEHFTSCHHILCSIFISPSFLFMLTYGTLCHVNATGDFFSFLLSSFFFSQLLKDFSGSLWILLHRSTKGDVSSDRVNAVTATVSRLDIGAGVDLKAEPTVEYQPVSAISECKCGMPLCICEAPAPSVDAVPQQVWILKFLWMFLLHLAIMCFIGHIFVCGRAKPYPPLSLDRIQDQKRQKPL